jgi:hypothetical protein
MNHGTLPAVLTALMLALPMLAARPAASGTASGGAAPHVAAAAEEKQRVPKPPPPPPKAEPDKPAASSSSSDNGGGDFFSNCLADCLSSCLESLFESLWTSCSSRHTPGPPQAPALADSAGAMGALPSSPAAGADTTRAEPAYEPARWSRYDVGYLRAYFPGDSVVLRRSASDPDSVQLESARLPDGARVLVNATHTGPGGTMLEVRPVDAPGQSGWVHEKSLRREPPPRPATPDAIAPEPSQPDTLGHDRMSVVAPPAPPVPAARPRWAIVLAAGPAVIKNADLNAEYSSGAAAVEAEYLRLMRSAWVAGAGVGYRGYSGKPGAEYLGATELDSPLYSRFRLTYAMAEFGQRHAPGDEIRYGYMVGPVVGYVFEDATIRILDPNTRVPIGGRHDRLGRWAGGGGATLWVSVPLPISIELGLRFRIFGLAWKGRHEQSLTSDYTDKGLLHIDGAITLTHAGR